MVLKQFLKILLQENKDEQWHRAMEYISATGELNYMTQIVIMMFEDPNKVCALFSLCLYNSPSHLFEAQLTILAVFANWVTRTFMTDQRSNTNI